jgi:hypothetical protein
MLMLVMWMLMLVMWVLMLVVLLLMVVAGIDSSCLFFVGCGDGACCWLWRCWC